MAIIEWNFDLAGTCETAVLGIALCASGVEPLFCADSHGIKREEPG